MTATQTTAKCTRCGRGLRAAKAIADGMGRTCKAKVAAAAKAATEYKPVQVAKAVETIELGAIVRAARPRLYLAVSSNGSTNYVVNTIDQSCTCKAGERGIRCYHLAAAQILNAA